MNCQSMGSSKFLYVIMGTLQHEVIALTDIATPVRRANSSLPRIIAIKSIFLSVSRSLITPVRARSGQTSDHSGLEQIVFYQKDRNRRFSLTFTSLQPKRSRKTIPANATPPPRARSQTS